jgi:CRP-like cAMP-binding protein
VTQQIRELSDALLRNLATLAVLHEDDREAVRKLPIQYVTLRADREIVREGDRPARSCIILRGMTCWSKTTSTGNRQIMAFDIAGDIPDLQSLHLAVMDSNLVTVTPCEVGFVQHEALRALCKEYPRLANAFWKKTLIESAIFREWVVNVGGRPAIVRIAHLLCEMMMRMEAVGLTEDRTCDFPITQSVLADATGLSTVHVNRSLQALRKEGMVTVEGGRLQIHQWTALANRADFDPTYLHLKEHEFG